MDRVKTLIVDDEEMARQELTYLLDLDDRFEVTDEAANGREAINALKENNYGLVLLDIKMPGFSGMEVARSLNEFDKPPHIVFTTAYDEYAVEAFKLAAVDYLLKPINEERFKDTLDRIWERLKKDGEKEKEEISDKIDSILHMFEADKGARCKIPVEDKGRYRMIDYSSIFYFSTEDKKVMVHTKANSYPTHLKLKDLENCLPSNFFRIHRSYIANLNHVKEVIPWFKGKYQIVMDDEVEHEIPVSRSKVKKLNQLLNLK